MALKPSDYVHLHNHTQYSVLDGLTKIPALIDTVKASGMTAVAKTDHGTLSGGIEFYKAAGAAEIKPIIGMETYVAARSHTDKDPQKDKQRYHLILLAMNDVGYHNLMRLSSIANLDGYYYFPRVDHELLEKYNEGLIVTSACMGGEIGNALSNGQTEKATETAKWYQKIFGDRYYLEIQDHGHPDNPLHSAEQEQINGQVLKLGKDLNIPVVVTCDAHYLKHSDQDAHEILLCVGTGSFLSDEKRMSLKEFPLHVEDPKNIIKRWGKDHPEVITNTKKIADRCQVNIELGKILIPKFPVPKGEDEKSYLHKMVWRGLVFRYLPDNKAYETLSIKDCQKLLPKNIVERANFELGVISTMGYNGYFLIVSDFIQWGKDQGIIFGPGRGSAAGSIVSYSLRITELDPLKYDLLFERFLNPDRISMPDIDIDIQDSRRNEVIEYCVRKYGSERVANIVTFGRMAARNAIRDVSRVLEVPYAEADRLSKMVPPPVQGKHTPLSTSLKEDADLKREYQTNPTAKKVFDLAVQLDGTVRSHGIHAAGVVIAPDDLVKFAPLEMAQKGVVATQYPMGPVEELGLLKMDFLGLTNLTIIGNAVRIIRKVHKKDIDIMQISLDDKKAFELFQKGDTTGIFQFESAGMRRYLRQLKPSVFEDIIAMVALYRPGPMQFIDDFIACKHGEKDVTYFHPKMQNALENTYGVLVYQEQVMQISKDLCGFTGGQADTLRKAIGKKKIEVLRKVKQEFIDGAIKTSGAKREKMEEFWGQLEDFAAYCFNKSHAACYGLIAYQTAYLRAHYPAAYMAALMTSAYGDTDRLAIEITECKKMGLDVLPPDVNESFSEFAVVPGKNQIRFGLDAVKNVGSNAVAEILRAREDGKFTSLEDFFSRVDNHVVNRKTLESLIKTGAFDRFNDRGLLLSNLDVLSAFAARLQKDKLNGQTDLFGNSEHKVQASLELENSSSASEHEYLAWERELLGLYLSHHPLEIYKELLAEQALAIKDLKPEYDRKTVVVGGLVSDIREITTKNGQKMAFVKIEDMDDELEIILFPKSYQLTAGSWQRDKVVLVTGKVSSTDKDGNPTDEIKLMVDHVAMITPEQATSYQPTGKSLKPPTARRVATVAAKKASPKTVAVAEPKLYVRLENTSDQAALLQLKQLIDDNSGQTDVVLVLGDGVGRQAIKLPSGVTGSETVLNDLSNLVGAENVKLQ